MSAHPPATHRFPRARVDPIDSAPIALGLLRRIAVPEQHETLLLVLDDARRGLAVVTVTDTDDDDHVLTVVDTLARPDLCGGEAAALIVASVRPFGTTTPADVDRWFEMSELADQGGLELVEWFVIGRSVSCPRDRVGAPPRWRAAEPG